MRASPFAHASDLTLREGDCIRTRTEEEQHLYDRRQQTIRDMAEYLPHLHKRTLTVQEQQRVARERERQLQVDAEARRLEEVARRSQRRLSRIAQGRDELDESDEDNGGGEGEPSPSNHQGRNRGVSFSEQQLLSQQQQQQNSVGGDGEALDSLLSRERRRTEVMLLGGGDGDGANATSTGEEGEKAQRNQQPQRRRGSVAFNVGDLSAIGDNDDEDGGGEGGGGGKKIISSGKALNTSATSSSATTPAGRSLDPFSFSSSSASRGGLASSSNKPMLYPSSSSPHQRRSSSGSRRGSIASSHGTGTGHPHSNGRNKHGRKKILDFMQEQTVAERTGIDMSSMESCWDTLTDGTWLNSKRRPIFVGQILSVNIPEETVLVSVWRKDEHYYTQEKRPLRAIPFAEVEKISPLMFSQICKSKYLRKSQQQNQMGKDDMDGSTPFALLEFNNRVVGEILEKTRIFAREKKSHSGGGGAPSAYSSPSRSRSHHNHHRGAESPTSQASSSQQGFPSSNSAATTAAIRSVAEIGNVSLINGYGTRAGGPSAAAASPSTPQRRAMTPMGTAHTSFIGRSQLLDPIHSGGGREGNATMATSPQIQSQSRPPTRSQLLSRGIIPAVAVKTVKGKRSGSVYEKGTTPTTSAPRANSAAGAGASAFAGGAGRLNSTYHPSDSSATSPSSSPASLVDPRVGIALRRLTKSSQLEEVNRRFQGIDMSQMDSEHQHHYYTTRAAVNAFDPSVNPKNSRYNLAVNVERGGIVGITSAGGALGTTPSFSLASSAGTSGIKMSLSGAFITRGRGAVMADPIPEVRSIHDQLAAIRPMANELKQSGIVIKSAPRTPFYEVEAERLASRVIGGAEDNGGGEGGGGKGHHLSTLPRGTDGASGGGGGGATAGSIPRGSLVRRTLVGGNGGGGISPVDASINAASAGRQQHHANNSHNPVNTSGVVSMGASASLQHSIATTPREALVAAGTNTARRQQQQKSHPRHESTDTMMMAREEEEVHAITFFSSSSSSPHHNANNIATAAGHLTPRAVASVAEGRRNVPPPLMFGLAPSVSSPSPPPMIEVSSPTNTNHFNTHNTQPFGVGGGRSNVNDAVNLASSVTSFTGGGGPLSVGMSPISSPNSMSPTSSPHMNNNANNTPMSGGRAAGGGGGGKSPLVRALEASRSKAANAIRMDLGAGQQRLLGAANGGGVGVSGGGGLGARGIGGGMSLSSSAMGPPLLTEDGYLVLPSPMRSGGGRLGSPPRGSSSASADVYHSSYNDHAADADAMMYSTMRFPLFDPRQSMSLYPIFSFGHAYAVRAIVPVDYGAMSAAVGEAVAEGLAVLAKRRDEERGAAASAINGGILSPRGAGATPLLAGSNGGSRVPAEAAPSAPAAKGKMKKKKGDRQQHQQTKKVPAVVPSPQLTAGIGSHGGVDDGDDDTAELPFATKRADSVGSTASASPPPSSAGGAVFGVTSPGSGGSNSSNNVSPSLGLASGRSSLPPSPLSRPPMTVAAGGTSVVTSRPPSAAVAASAVEPLSLPTATAAVRGRGDVDADAATEHSTGRGSRSDRGHDHQHHQHRRRRHRSDRPFILRRHKQFVVKSLAEEPPMLTGVPCELRGVVSAAQHAIAISSQPHSHHGYNQQPNTTATAVGGGGVNRLTEVGTHPILYITAAAAAAAAAAEGASSYRDQHNVGGGGSSSSSSQPTAVSLAFVTLWCPPNTAADGGGNATTGGGNGVSGGKLLGKRGSMSNLKRTAAAAAASSSSVEGLTSPAAVAVAGTDGSEVDTSPAAVAVANNSSAPSEAGARSPNGNTNLFIHRTESVVSASSSVSQYNLNNPNNNQQQQQRAMLLGRSGNASTASSASHLAVHHHSSSNGNGNGVNQPPQSAAAMAINDHWSRVMGRYCVSTNSTSGAPNHHCHHSQRGGGSAGGGKKGSITSLSLGGGGAARGAADQQHQQQQQHAHAALLQGHTPSLCALATGTFDGATGAPHVVLVVEGALSSYAGSVRKAQSEANLEHLAREEEGLVMVGADGGGRATAVGGAGDDGNNIGGDSLAASLQQLAGPIQMVTSLGAFNTTTTANNNASATVTMGASTSRLTMTLGTTNNGIGNTNPFPSAAASSSSPAPPPHHLFTLQEVLVAEGLAWIVLPGNVIAALEATQDLAGQIGSGSSGSQNVGANSAQLQQQTATIQHTRGTMKGASKRMRFFQQSHSSSSSSSSDGDDDGGDSPDLSSSSRHPSSSASPPSSFSSPSPPSSSPTLQLLRQKQSEEDMFLYVLDLVLEGPKKKGMHHQRDVVTTPRSTTASDTPPPPPPPIDADQQLHHQLHHHYAQHYAHLSSALAAADKALLRRYGAYLLRLLGLQQHAIGRRVGMWDTRHGLGSVVQHHRQLTQTIISAHQQQQQQQQALLLADEQQQQQMASSSNALHSGGGGGPPSAPAPTLKRTVSAMGTSMLLTSSSMRRTASNGRLLLGAGGGGGGPDQQQLVGSAATASGDAFDINTEGVGGAGVGVGGGLSRSPSMREGGNAIKMQLVQRTSSLKLLSAGLSSMTLTAADGAGNSGGGGGNTNLSSTTNSPTHHGQQQQQPGSGAASVGRGGGGVPGGGQSLLSPSSYSGAGRGGGVVGVMAGGRASASTTTALTTNAASSGATAASNNAATGNSSNSGGATDQAVVAATAVTASTVMAALTAGGIGSQFGVSSSSSGAGARGGGGGAGDLHHQQPSPYHHPQRGTSASSSSSPSHHHHHNQHHHHHESGVGGGGGVLNGAVITCMMGDEGRPMESLFDAWESTNAALRGLGGGGGGSR